MLSALKAAREWAAPELPPAVAGVPWLTATGQLTADDFVAAGDRLIRVSPSWRWARAVEGRVRPALPLAKQCLVLEGVPCRAMPSMSATHSSTHAHEERIPGALGDWLSASGDAQGSHILVGARGDSGSGCGVGGDDDIPLIGTVPSAVVAVLPASSSSETSVAVEAAAGDEEYADLADFVDKSLLVRDPALVAPSLATSTTPAAATGAAAASVAASAGAPAATTRAPRTYQLSITYDGYYHTPRVFLRGYSMTGAPLAPEAMLEDVVQDYVAKTVTMETHPLLGTLCLSVHPCRHAATMKALAAGSLEPPPSDAYLLLFLKFFAGVVPGLEYDTTMGM